MIKKNFKLIIVLMIILSISAGCSFFEKKKTKWRPVKDKNQVFLHEVKWEDESYEIIAKWYSGKKENTELIINANPTLNPEHLKVGDRVFIPKKIIRTRNNFSRKYVKSFNKKPVTKIKQKYVPQKNRKPEKDAENFELFGPR